MRCAALSRLCELWRAIVRHREIRSIAPLVGDLGRQRFGLAGFPVVMARVFWAWALAERGDFDDALTRAQEAVQLAETLDHPYSIAFACRALGYVHAVKGEFRQALPVLERGVGLAREWNLRFIAPLLTGMLGHVYAATGRLGEGQQLLQQALDALEPLGITMYLPSLMVHAGEAQLLEDGGDRAKDLAQGALALARERGQRGHEACAQRLIAEIAARRDTDIDAAEACYAEALSSASALSMRPLVAHCHAGLGKALRRAGRHAASEEHLGRATVMYREMDMRFWLELLDRDAVEPA